MKQRPILFSTPMVNAILEGRKTQTRRIVKANLDHECWIGSEDGPISAPPDWSHESLKNGELWCGNCGYHALKPVKCPYGKPGDILWVRETWAATCGGKFEYKSDGGYPPRIVHESANESGGEDIVTERWFPSIHMPKCACRLFLRITNIRVERLQDITEEDAKAEGAQKMHLDDLGQSFATYKRGFQAVWEGINGAESWHLNPWLWVVSFERIDPKEH